MANTILVCQRPERAYFISTDEKQTEEKHYEKILCQRPERAYFISTVPSKTP